MTAKPSAERQRAYREAAKKADRVRLPYYVTSIEAAKLKALGGADWLRDRINRAKLPTKG